MMFIIQLLLPVANELQLYIRATQLNMYYSHALRGSSFFFHKYSRNPTFCQNESLIYYLKTNLD